MRVLLTGATGLIGSAVHRELLDKHDVVTLGRRPSADVQADLADPGSIMRATSLGNVDALVHCAGVVDEDFHDDPERAFRTAIRGADALVGLALDAGARRLVYVSSAHVYGPMIGRKNELSLPDPRSDYAIAHFATEQVFRRQVSADVSTMALRPCAVFGDLPDPAAFRRWSLIPFAFPRAAMEVGEIVIRSTGEQRRNFVGTGDIAHSLARWLDVEASGSSVVNAVGACSMSVYEFARLCVEVAQDLTGRSVELVRELPDGATVGDDFEYSSCSTVAAGDQDIRTTLERIMTAVGAVT